MTPLARPVRIGSLTLRNRLYRAPVLEGAGRSRDPASVYVRHFGPNARAGVGLIVQGNTIVLPEGRTSPGMNAITEVDQVHALAPVPGAVHDAGGAIVIQLGHGGIFALESWHKAFMEARTHPPFAASPPPWWLRATHGRVKVLDTGEVRALVERFGLVARWAKEAGYDAVQLAGSNAKLLHQFSSPTFNQRTDRYGGGVYGRATLLREIRDAISRSCGPDFPVLLKYCAQEVGLGRMTLDEGVEIGRIAQDAGFDALTPVSASVLPDTALCRGGFPAESFRNTALKSQLAEAAGSRMRAGVIQASMRYAAWKYPFEPVWNREVFAAVKRAVGIPVFAVGGVRTPEQAAEILRSGDADLIGIGRPFYAEPDLAQRFLDGEEAACESCNRCIVPQMLGMPGVCYNPATHKAVRSAEPMAAK